MSIPFKTWNGRLVRPITEGLMKTSNIKKIKLQLTQIEFLYFCSQLELFKLKQRHSYFLLALFGGLSGIGLYQLYFHIPWFPFQRFLFISLWLLLGTVLTITYVFIQAIFEERFISLIEELNVHSENHFKGEEIKDGNE